MAITAGTVNKDRVYRGGGSAKSVFESGLPYVGSGSTFKQGSFMCYDTGTNLIRPVVATADAATLVGISPVAVTSGKLVGPYDGLTDTNAAQAPQDFRGPIAGFTAKMILKNGDAFLPGLKVYLADGLDDQTVSVTDPGDHNYVGFYDGPAFTPGAAGLEGPVHIIARYPGVQA